MLQLMATATVDTAQNTIWGLNATWSAIIMMLISVLCGLALGAERSVREKEAGVRTHIILIIGATLFTIISCSFVDDSARIMAQVVVGVGFIGAGIIMFRGEALHGLTTAAGIWTTAGIGMAIGNGMIVLGIITTVIVLVCQVGFHAHSNGKQYRYIRICFVYNVETVDQLKAMFGVRNFGRLKMQTREEGIVADTILRTREDCSIETLSSIMKDNASVLSVERLDINRY